MQLEQFLVELSSFDAVGEVEFQPGPVDSVQLVDATHDSRAVHADTLFCAVPGQHFDGHDFVEAAANGGAVAALVERFVPTDIAQLKVNSVRGAMAAAASIVHGHPSREMVLFGITGTNGKTTTTRLFADIVRSTGRRCAVIGTIGSAHTTPESPRLQRMLRELADAGTDVVALEVSSHALDQHRADATEFTVAAFSNLTPDHLNYHETMQAYFEAKAKLFDGRAQNELVNVDDAWGAKLIARRPAATAISLADIEIVNEAVDGTDFVWRGHAMRVPLPGNMNVANALVAIEAAAALGLDETAIAHGLRNADQVPGRMQVVDAQSRDAHPIPTVIVDYSHTPDSITRALQTIRSVAPSSNISIVFGCGGDRDRTKRPLMAAAAETDADRVFITNDNPRSEEPMAIIADALGGLRTPAHAIVEPDRKVAITRAITEAGPGDVVLIAGKGHEKTQTIGSDVLPFDDVTVARAVLEETTP